MSKNCLSSKIVFHKSWQEIRKNFLEKSGNWLDLVPTIPYIWIRLTWTTTFIWDAWCHPMWGTWEECEQQIFSQNTKNAGSPFFGSTLKVTMLPFCENLKKLGKVINSNCKSIMLHFLHLCGGAGKAELYSTATAATQWLSFAIGGLFWTLAFGLYLTSLSITIEFMDTWYPIPQYGPNSSQNAVIPVSNVYYLVWTD